MVVRLIVWRQRGLGRTRPFPIFIYPSPSRETEGKQSTKRAANHIGGFRAYMLIGSNLLLDECLKCNTPCK